MQERITHSNKSPNKAMAAKPVRPASAYQLKSKKSTSTEVQIGSSLNNQLSSNREVKDTGADIMHQMHQGNCSDVINSLTTHDKIKMMHGIMETQRLQQQSLKQEA